MNFPSDKVLMITTSHVGNTIFCTPAIRLLKKHRPNLQIDVVALHKRAASVLQNNPDIKNIYVKTHARALQKLVSAYPMSICLNHASFTDYLANYQGNVVTIGPSDPTKHRTAEIVEFMQGLLGCTLTDEDCHYQLYPLSGDDRSMKKLISYHSDQIFVGIHLGTSRTQIHGWKFWYKKRTQDPRLWSLENYIDLAARIQQVNPEIRFVLTGDKSERFLGKAFAQKIANTINLMGKTSLTALAALMNSLRVFVTHDTGVLHVACAMRVPLVSLFGSTDPLRTGPYPVAKHHIILKSEAISHISPEKVFQSVLAQLT